MEISSKTQGNIIGSAPQLDTVLMVEDFIKNNKEYTVGETFRALPKKMLWRTFKIIIAYLENTHKIIIDKNNTIIWIWNPELIEKTKHLEIKL